MAAEDLLASASSLVQLCLLPSDDLDRPRLLTRMAELIRDAVPAADYASVCLGSPLQPEWVGTDSAEAQTFDGCQIRAGEGPCRDAFDSRAVIATDDVTSDPRWPTLAREASASAVRSVIGFPIGTEETTEGTVNVHSRRTGGLADLDRRLGELATQAVVGVLHAVIQRESMRGLAVNLERALTSRAVIDQAKGVLMARLGVDADNAFARLVDASTRMNVKLRDLAALVIAGELDAVRGTTP